jgi:hypothetical protein
VLFVAAISIAGAKLPEAKILFLPINQAVISQSIATLAGDFWGEMALFSPKMRTIVL